MGPVRNAVAMLLVLVALAACVRPSPQGEGAARPLSTPDIAVSALGDVPAPGEGARQAGPAPPADATRGEEMAATGTDADTPAEEAAPRSPAQVACERGGGIWTRTPNGSAGCVRYTRDGGRECRRAGDCEGECLARSGTCAPIRPLFGCNDILDDTGRRMNVCLE